MERWSWIHLAREVEEGIMSDDLVLALVLFMACGVYFVYQLGRWVEHNSRRES